MNLLLLVLKNDTYLVSLVETLEYEPNCHLQYPHTFKPYKSAGGYTFQPWPQYSGDEDILIHSTDILTICEPEDRLREAYLKKIGKTEEDLTETSKQVILNEDIDPDSLDWVDDYNPPYVEEAS
jgi:hypothetical protein